MNEFVAFDLEIAKEIENGLDWREQSPLGISCAALGYEDNEIINFYEIPKITKDQCQSLVMALDRLSQEKTLVTWNGCKFDLPVLAEESGMYNRCSEIALRHVDLMMIVTFTKGWYLGLNTALKGAGLSGKLKEVRLNDGTVLKDMSGAKAPKLWADGEHQAVLDYLEMDVLPLAKLARKTSENLEIRWTSRSGNPQICSMDKLYSVEECFEIPEPDTSWMSDPPTRKGFVDWMSDEYTKGLL